MTDEHPSLEKFVDQVGRLYSPPTVALEILTLTGQPKVDLTALEAVLATRSGIGQQDAASREQLAVRP